MYEYVWICTRSMGPQAHLVKPDLEYLGRHDSLPLRAGQGRVAGNITKGWHGHSERPLHDQDRPSFLRHGADTKCMGSTHPSALLG